MILILTVVYNMLRTHPVKVYNDSTLNYLPQIAMNTHYPMTMLIGCILEYWIHNGVHVAILVTDTLYMEWFDVETGTALEKHR